MVMKDPNLKKYQDEDEVDPFALEEEILRVEREKKEIIRKIGGDQYDRLLKKLIQKKVLKNFRGG